MTKYRVKNGQYGVLTARKGTDSQDGILHRRNTLLWSALDIRSQDAFQCTWDKDVQSPLGFLLLPLDLQSIQLHGKKLPHLTLEIFHLIYKFIFGQSTTPNISTCSHLLQRNVFFFFSPRGSLNMPCCPPKGPLITTIKEERRLAL